MVDAEVSPQTVCVPSEDVVAREIEGEMIIVPLTSGIGDADDALFTLNVTGQAIWHKLDGTRTLAQVADELVQEFHVPRDQAEEETVGFCGEMVRQGILSSRP